MVQVFCLFGHNNLEDQDITENQMIHHKHDVNSHLNILLCSCICFCSVLSHVSSSVLTVCRSYNINNKPNLFETKQDNHMIKEQKQIPSIH